MSQIPQKTKRLFGRPGSGRGASAFPKIRFVALLENGTHVLWSAVMDKYAKAETTLALSVVTALRKDMLCMADRFFPSYKLWRAAQTGAPPTPRQRQARAQRMRRAGTPPTPIRPGPV